MCKMSYHQIPNFYSPLELFGIDLYAEGIECRISDERSHLLYETCIRVGDQDLDLVVELLDTEDMVKIFGVGHTSKGLADRKLLGVLEHEFLTVREIEDVIQGNLNLQQLHDEGFVLSEDIETFLYE